MDRYSIVLDCDVGKSIFTVKVDSEIVLLCGLCTKLMYRSLRFIKYLCTFVLYVIVSFLV